MKKLLILSVFSFLFAACNDDPESCVSGSGTIAQYNLTFASFDEISLSGPIDLHVVQGNDQIVTVDATSEVFSRMQNTQSGNRVEIGFMSNSCFSSGPDVLVTITVPNLTLIDISGVSLITSDELALDQLALTSSGTSSMQMKGQIINQTINASGVVNVRNFDVLSNNVSITVSGSGDFEVSCSDQLNIDISGAATIKYKGDPIVDQRSSGSLTLTKVE